MTEATARPSAPAPNFAAIPTELTSRPQWVCWRYELDRKGKWTKVPYTPGTTRKASHSKPSTWRSFKAAVNCYLERPDFFDGIGYVFAADDPYVGGDIDHSLNTDRLPPTYAEISPSDTGIKFIARASGDYGRKTARGELYSRQRFFTITGNVLPGHEAITTCQEAVEAFAASLGVKCTPRKMSGKAGAGDRAALLGDIPESTWEEARVLNRTQRESLIRRVKAAGGRDTQLALVLAGDYAGFHRRWAFVGLYRADGSLDDSQVRAVAAYGIKGRGFTFPEYVVIMSALYAQQALAKWGAKERWREELAALWDKAPGPKFPPRGKKAHRVARGRAGNHAALVEQAYSFLQAARAGAQALIHLADLAVELGTHRSTASAILAELTAAGRIERRRLAGGGGLLISFKRDVGYSIAPAAESPAPAQPNDDRPAIAEETLEYSLRVSSDREMAEISTASTLAELVDEAIDAYGPRFKRVLLYFAANAPGHCWSEARIKREYQWKIKQRSWARRDAREVERARALSREALQRKSRSLATQAAGVMRALKEGQKLPAQLRYEVNGKTYRTKAPVTLTEKYAKLLLHRAGIYAAEEDRRALAEQERIDLLGYALAEQAEMLELVDAVRIKRRGIARAAHIEVQHAPAIREDHALLANLYTRLGRYDDAAQYQPPAASAA